MAVMANGARLEFDGYDWARVHEGEILETGDLDNLRARKQALGNRLKGEIVFRAHYVSPWIPVSNAPDD